MQRARRVGSRGSAGALRVTDEQLARVRDRMHELFAQWEAVPPGGALELPFDIPATAST